MTVILIARESASTEHQTVFVEKLTLITAGTVIGGSGLVSRNVWLGLNSAIRQKKVIGNLGIIGIGANVFANVPDNAALAGFPGQRVPK